MGVSRKGFLAGSAAAAVAAGSATSLVSAETATVAGMTFTTLRDGNVDHLGIRTPHGVIDVARAATAMGISDAPVTVEDVVCGRGSTGALHRIVAQAPAASMRSESSVQYGPLVSSPEKILCVGLNYRAHLAETNMKAQPYPDLFNKYNTSLNRHNGTVAVSTLPLVQFDYESELVMIIGKEARNVSEADALGYVFGYACGNDFSARDAQLRVSQWMTGKTPDQFAPLGPWLVTADQIGDPQALQIQTFVNDEKTPRQDMSTAQMIFSCAKIISYMSQFITLRPGDVIFSGTPSGVILGYPKDQQVWLKAGDRITTKITKLGELKFTLV
ncbi:MAG TPA: fumarylacetoacetate hydrolase family protein [Candidatus Acidoferrum sp.]|jgi:2-keto-4-pentenoate hydratase/2-oxohepta-3-ene-1,7-dioic acid hydratase in catechol pathway|nr:fumarylacetoacetate hydrolase family protein [Candidatus Acidoferrum sp.]